MSWFPGARSYPDTTTSDHHSPRQQHHPAYGSVITSASMPMDWETHGVRGLGLVAARPFAPIQPLIISPEVGSFQESFTWQTYTVQSPQSAYPPSEKQRVHWPATPSSVAPSTSFNREWGVPPDAQEYSLVPSLNSEPCDTSEHSRSTATSVDSSPYVSSAHLLGARRSPFVKLESPLSADTSPVIDQEMSIKAECQHGVNPLDTIAQASPLTSRLVHTPQLTPRAPTVEHGSVNYSPLTVQTRIPAKRRRRLTTRAEAIHGCDECDLWFKRSSNYNKHMEIRHSSPDYRPFVCEVEDCKMAFKRKTDRQRHFNSRHTDDMKHCCTRCGRGFARKDTLTRHEDSGCPMRALIPLAKLDQDRRRRRRQNYNAQRRSNVSSSAKQETDDEDYEPLWS